MTIRVGAVPDVLPAPAERSALWESAPGDFLLRLDEVARFRVSEGREILVQPTGGDDDVVTALLLGSAVVACLQQRGVLTLHASAIETDQGGVLLAGIPGVGKSTLLAALVERGYPMVADDVSGIVLNSDGDPTVLPAIPRIRLWANAVDALGWGERTGGRVRDQLEKYFASIERFRAVPVALRGVFVLGSHSRDAIVIKGASPAAAVALLLEHTCRRNYLRGLGQGPDHFRAVTAVARRVPVARAIRPRYPFRPGALADEIERRLPGKAPGWQDKEAHRDGR